VLTPLRREIRALLDRTEVCRPPALRRALSPEALLVTDLPSLVDAERLAAFVRETEAKGWRAWTESGWLLLNHLVEAPEIRPRPLTGEAACCLSLFLRHPGGEAPPAAVRALVKAAEAGSGQVQRLCAGWHRDYAARLRRHEPLPSGLTPYLYAAFDEGSGEEMG